MKRLKFANFAFLGVAAVFALVLTSCFGGGGDDDESSDETTTTSAAPTVQTLAPVVEPVAPVQPPTPTAAPPPAPTTAAPPPAPTTAAPASGGLTYTVQSGDTLAAIADRFNVTVDEIISANNITNADVISIGQQFIIPTGSGGGTGSGTAPSGTTASGATGTTSPDGSTYTVASGDSLASIANRFNVSLDDLLEANPDIENQDVISIGQVINIPSS